jgi:hypothetical protein
LFCHFIQHFQLTIFRYLCHYEKTHLMCKLFACDACEFTASSVEARNAHLEMEHLLCATCDYEGMGQNPQSKAKVRFIL